MAHVYKQRQNAKKQAALVRRESRKTGGGPPPEKLTTLQDNVVSIIGNTQIDGMMEALTLS